MDFMQGRFLFDQFSLTFEALLLFSEAAFQDGVSSNDLW